MDCEIWKPIPGLPGYDASSLGRIRSHDRIVQCKASATRGAWTRKVKGQMLTLHLWSDGRWFTSVNNKTIPVAPLVCAAFNGLAPVGKPNACHCNGDKSDNVSGNLKWGSQKDNCDDRAAHGTTARGSRQGNSILTERDVIKIKRMLLRKVRGDVIGNIFGVDLSTISDIKRGKRWSHVSHGL